MRSSDEGVHLTLLGGFQAACDGEPIQFGLGAQRLLALLAVRSGGVSRAAAAEELWPGSRRGRAAANLRSALSQGKRIGKAVLVEEVGARLFLASSVEVEVRTFAREAHAIVDLSTPYHHSADERVISVLSRELLPEWFDDWLLVERERWNQVRLHALETLAHRLMDLEQYLTAHEAALAAVAIEPVRESAHRIVMEIYIAEGNEGCALKHYQRYRWLLERELGVRPSALMDRLVDGLQSV
jgi:DNA-binding SARP family transcriptional activator